MPSNCKHPSASDQHRRQVEHVTRRARGSGELESARATAPKRVPTSGTPSALISCRSRVLSTLVIYRGYLTWVGFQDSTSVTWDRGNHGAGIHPRGLTLEISGIFAEIVRHMISATIPGILPFYQYTRLWGGGGGGGGGGKRMSKLPYTVLVHKVAKLVGPAQRA